MINQKQFEAYNIPAEKFTIVANKDMHDLKLDTKPVGYFKDAFRRFTKNKASVTAAIIIIFLLLFAIVGPFISKFEVAYTDISMAKLLPKSNTFKWLGWDGCKKEEINQSKYLSYLGISKELNQDVVTKLHDTYQNEEALSAVSTYINNYYVCDVDSYLKDAVKEVQLTKEQYESIQKYQDENNIQVILPMTTYIFDDVSDVMLRNDPKIWYKVNTSGIKSDKYLPLGVKTDTPADEVEFQHSYKEKDSYDDHYTSKMRLEGSEAKYIYAKKVGANADNYLVRINYMEYFEFKYGFEPVFLFGSNEQGQDLFVQLSSGARFSLIFAVCISAINLIIGAIYGAIEGYYGGTTDMVMERITDILGGVPFMIVVTLFKLHIMKQVGTIVTMLFAFVLTGWIGMASNTRMQFYRYKNQEYVLAARTLGASDRRIMFKHIFPNALGTLITSCVLVIPGVIFSESSLSYLGIVNLGTGSTTSVGTLMASGRNALQNYPHIILFPSAFVALLMITFKLFGNGLRDAFNPSLRGMED